MIATSAGNTDRDYVLTTERNTTNSDDVVLPSDQVAASTFSGRGMPVEKVKSVNISFSKHQTGGVRQKSIGEWSKKIEAVGVIQSGQGSKGHHVKKNSLR